MPDFDDYEPDEDEYSCSCSDCTGDDEIEIAGEPRSWCSRCNSREDHFLENEEIYVCDCEAAELLAAYGNNYPIVLARPLKIGTGKPAYA